MDSMEHHKQHPAKRSEDTTIGIKHGKVAELIDNIRQQQQNSVLNRKMAPSIPPKPQKKRTEMPQVCEQFVVDSTFVNLHTHKYIYNIRRM